jgi:hypothetical protein
MEQLAKEYVLRRQGHQADHSRRICGVHLFAHSLQMLKE